MNHYDRIIHIESDAYLLSNRICNFIRHREKGWTAFYTKRWNTPETNIQIICKEQYLPFTKYWKSGRNFWFKNGFTDPCYIPEYCLPFTSVIMKYNGDRYGEDFFESIPKNLDYICQTSDISMHGLGMNQLKEKQEQIDGLINKAKEKL